MAWQAVYTNQLNALTTAQQEENVDIIYAYFNALGWQINPIAAMLGNMHVESQLNPAQWENGYPIENTTLPLSNPGNSGFGLSQWTPWSKIRDAIGSSWKTNYTAQLDRINFEAQPENQGVQWIPVASYDRYTFQQFAHDTTHTLEWLVGCYEYSYERGTPAIPTRLGYAQQWLAYLQTHPPGPGPGPTPTSRTGMPVWMMCRPTRRRF